MVTKADAGKMAALTTVNRKHARTSCALAADVSREDGGAALPRCLPDEQDSSMQLWRRNNHCEGGFLKLDSEL